MLNPCILAALARAIHQGRLTMRTFVKWSMVLLIPTVFGATARPAEHAIPEDSTIKLLLLRQKSVQKELELSPEAVKMVMEFTHEQAESAKQALGLGESARKMAFEKLTEKNEKFLTGGTLTPKQGKRLDQIAMQFAALQHLTKPEMAKTLNLTDAQVQKFKDLRTESHKTLVEIMSPKGSEGKTEKLAKHREETRTKILVILTEEQKVKVRELVGPPFEGEIIIEEIP
jgi:hypothetical protein